jgi:hypothetical protein
VFLYQEKSCARQSLDFCWTFLQMADRKWRIKLKTNFSKILKCCQIFTANFFFFSFVRINFSTFSSFVLPSQEWKRWPRIKRVFNWNENKVSEIQDWIIPEKKFLETSYQHLNIIIWTEFKKMTWDRLAINFKLQTLQCQSITISYFETWTHSMGEIRKHVKHLESEIFFFQ